MLPVPPRKISLKGSPKEVGFEHGRLLEKEIKNQMQVYGEMFEVTSKLSWTEILEVAKEFSLTIERLTPDLYEEMEAIAAGAQVQLLDIVALNCRSEIALGLFSDGCTSLAWSSKDDFGSDRTVLAQNWDWTARVKKNLVMMSIEQEGKPKIFMITEAGIVGKIGFNSAAVGTCLNAIRARPMISSKIPIHVALRLCLQCTSVDNAIKSLEAIGGIASSQHILIADGTKAVGLELSPVGNVYLQADGDGVVTHSNHFIENNYAEEVPWLVGSSIRLAQIRRLWSELKAEHPSELMSPEVPLRQRIFADTFNAPQAICCQEDPNRPFETRSSTLFNIIMFLKADKPSAQVVWGRPGSGEEGEVLSMPW